MGSPGPSEFPDVGLKLVVADGGSVDCESFILNNICGKNKKGDKNVVLSNKGSVDCKSYSNFI